MKLKSFCTAKKTINKTQRQPSEQEKMKQWAKNSSPKYTNSSWSSISNKQTTQLKNGQKT